MYATFNDMSPRIGYWLLKEKRHAQTMVRAYDCQHLVRLASYISIRNYIIT